MRTNELTEIIISAAMEVHRTLGPGLLESAYLVCMKKELSLRGIPYAAEVPLPVVYKGEQLDCGYRVDLLVDNRVVVELKAVNGLEACMTLRSSLTSASVAGTLAC